MAGKWVAYDATGSPVAATDKSYRFPSEADAWEYLRLLYRAAGWSSRTIKHLLNGCKVQKSAS